MAMQKPVLQITAGIDKKATVKNVQSQLDSISKSLKLTIGVDKSGKEEIKKQVDEYGRLLDVEKAHAQAIIKDIKITETAKKKAITSEIADRERVAKIIKKQNNEEISDIANSILNNVMNGKKAEFPHIEKLVSEEITDEVLAKVDKEMKRVADFATEQLGKYL